VIGSPVLFSAHDDRPSVILISIDTLRADHVGCYGHQRDTTPFLDLFFTREGVYFTDFSAAAPYTLPSHASLFSGQFPTVHEVQQADHRLVDASPHLADLLAQQGYVTAAFTGGGFVGYEYGFRRGFDRFAIVDPLLAEDDHDRDFRPRLHDRPYNNRVFRDYRIDRALRFVRDHEGSPFFLFLHTFVVHNYVPRRPSRKRSRGPTSSATRMRSRCTRSTSIRSVASSSAPSSSPSSRTCTTRPFARPMTGCDRWSRCCAASISSTRRS
jgi:arylsulfatase A-like enzyme